MCRYKFNCLQVHNYTTTNVIFSSIRLRLRLRFRLYWTPTPEGDLKDMLSWTWMMWEGSFSPSILNPESWIVNPPQFVLEFSYYSETSLRFLRETVLSTLTRILSSTTSLFFTTLCFYFFKLSSHKIDKIIIILFAIFLKS